MINIKEWKIDPILKKEIEEHYRTRFALSIHNESVDNIFKKLTFDSVAPNISVTDVKNFVEFINKKFLNSKISRTGLEVGGGCGFFSAILANYPSVSKFYSVEICGNIVRQLMPKIVETVAQKNSSKIVACIGDFDVIELPDNSVDFIFDFYSLHHSSDLSKTFKGLYRVLKPGGFIFCFDKTRSNSLSKEDLEKLLDKQYSKEAKIAMGLSGDVYHTRRMNGEKEYRLKDWHGAFLDSGFKKFKHYHIARLPLDNSISTISKKIISILPIFIQVLITRIISRNGNKNDLEQSNKIYTKLVNNFPKEVSLMITYKI